MIPYDIDPSLHAHAPEPEQLGDGFSPPQGSDAPVPPGHPAPGTHPGPEESLGDKSPF